jgi:hypothetical protein
MKKLFVFLMIGFFSLSACTPSSTSTTSKSTDSSTSSVPNPNSSSSSATNPNIEDLVDVKFHFLNETNEVKTISVVKNQRVSLPANPIKEYLDGYNYAFNGWYYEDGNPFDIATSITQPIDLFAHYTQTLTTIAQYLSYASSWTTYTNNLVTKYLDDQNTIIDKQNTFTGTDKHYYVGTDNVFKLPIVGSVLEDENALTLAKYDLSIQLSILNNDTYELVPDYQSYLTHDENLSSNVLFKPAAINKNFKIEVSLPTDPEESLLFADIQVVEGFNIYNVNDLLSITNSVDDGVSIEYSDGSRLDEVSIRTTTQVRRAIFHDNLTIALSDIPQEYLQTSYKNEDLGGTYLRAWTRLFDFGVSSNGSHFGHYLSDSLDIIGNFFSLDAHNVPKVKADRGKGMIDEDFDPHTVLLGFFPKPGSSYVLKNMTIIGNSQYSDISKKGGLKLFAFTGWTVGETVSTYKDLVISNVHMLWGDTALEISDADALIEDCYVYDFFSLGLYGFEFNKVNVKNSVFLKFGGPAFLFQSTKSAILPHELSIDSESFLESSVIGEEAWFQLMKAQPLATAISSGFEVLANNYNKSIVTHVDSTGNKYFNPLVAFTYAPLFSLEDSHEQGKVIQTSGKVSIDGTDFYIDQFNQFSQLNDTNYELLQTNDNYKSLNGLYATSSANGILGVSQDTSPADGDYVFVRVPVLEAKINKVKYIAVLLKYVPLANN